MLANLSIVFDKEKEIRLDILKNVPISQIDEYTTTKTSSKEIREEYEEQISKFLEENQELIATFKKEVNKKGNLVIVYKDENDKLHRMRVLYQENKNKMNTDIILKRIFDVIRSTNDPEFTIELIRYFDFFLGSDFNYREVARIKKTPSTDVDILRRQNQRLINNIRNNIKYTLSQNPEKGYFYLRLIDAYIEKKGYETTKRKIKIQAGTIKTQQNIEIPSTKITKKQPYRKVVEEKKEEDNLQQTSEEQQYNFIKEYLEKEQPTTATSISEVHLEYLEYLEKNRRLVR